MPLINICQIHLYLLYSRIKTNYIGSRTDVQGLRGGKIREGAGGGWYLQNFKWGNEGAYFPHIPRFFQFFFVNISAIVSLFAHLKNSTFGNTGTDATGLVHIHHLVDLSLYVMLLT